MIIDILHFDSHSYQTCIKKQKISHISVKRCQDTVCCQLFYLVLQQEGWCSSSYLHIHSPQSQFKAFICGRWIQACRKMLHTFLPQVQKIWFFKNIYIQYFHEARMVSQRVLNGWSKKIGMDGKGKTIQEAGQESGPIRILITTSQKQPLKRGKQRDGEKINIPNPFLFARYPWCSKACVRKRLREQTDSRPTNRREKNRFPHNGAKMLCGPCA